jgi:hypothetical protein
MRDELPGFELPPDEGEPMTAIGLVSTTAFLLGCGVHPDDLGEAWAYTRAIQHEAEYPSEMGILVKHVQAFAAEKATARQRIAEGRFGRHTGPLSLPRRTPPLP